MAVKALTAARQDAHMARPHSALTRRAITWTWLASVASSAIVIESIGHVFLQRMGPSSCTERAHLRTKGDELEAVSRELVVDGAISPSAFSGG
jgi:hypothetical protein